MFTVIRAVLLKPLAYRDPDQLVRISGGATPARFNEMRASAHSYTAIGDYAGQENLTITGNSEPGSRKGYPRLRQLSSDSGGESDFGADIPPARGRGGRSTCGDDQRGVLETQVRGRSEYRG